MDIQEKVIKIVSEHLDVDEEKITPETSFDDLDADSLDVVEMVMTLEEEFELEIADEEVEKIKNIADVINYIKKNT